MLQKKCAHLKKKTVNFAKSDCRKYPERGSKAKVFAVYSIQYTGISVTISNYIIFIFERLREIMNSKISVN